MNKIIKKLLFLLTLTLSLTIYSAVAFAGTTSQVSEQSTVEASSDDLTECKSFEDGTIRFESSTSTGALTLSICQIDKLSSIYVEGTCEANANKIVSEIGYTMTFEKLQNGSWVSIGSVTNSVRNSYLIENSHIQKVTAGEYYRVRTVSYIIDNGVKTSKTSVSNSIYVN